MPFPGPERQPCVFGDLLLPLVISACDLLTGLGLGSKQGSWHPVPLDCRVTDACAGEAINAWVSRATHGRIETIVTPLIPVAVVAYVVSAF